MCQKSTMVKTYIQNEDLSTNDFKSVESGQCFYRESNKMLCGEQKMGVRGCGKALGKGIASNLGRWEVSDIHVFETHPRGGGSNMTCS